MNTIKARGKIDIADALIHVDEDLEVSEQEKLMEDMRMVSGVISPHFNRGNNHLLLVAFDPSESRSTELLKNVCDHGYHAQLIGL